MSVRALPRPARPGVRRAAALLALALPLGAGLTGCDDEVAAARSVAESCGERACPAGTAFHEKRSFSGGTDITGERGVAGTVSGAFSRFGEGDCEYVCQTITDCPASTFPVITTECFTCGVVLSDNTVDRGNCGE